MHDKVCEQVRGDVGACTGKEGGGGGREEEDAAREPTNYLVWLCCRRRDAVDACSGTSATTKSNPARSAAGVPDEVPFDVLEVRRFSVLVCGWRARRIASSRTWLRTGCRERRGSQEASPRARARSRGRETGRTLER